MDGRQGQHLPEGIESMPTGVALASALDGVDAASLSPFDAVRYVAARRRLLSREQALFAESTRECALAAPEHPDDPMPPADPTEDPQLAERPFRRESYGAYAGDELRMVLSWSKTMVWKQLGLAQDAIERLPALFAAWRAGELDQDRVRVFCQWTSALSTEHARSVVEILLPEAAGLTLQGLIERIREVAMGLDPKWASKLYDDARKQRRIRARRNESGTANLSGLDLPLDAVAISVARVSMLAARAKAAGHPGLMDTIKSDVYLALLSPKLAGKDDDAVVAAVVAGARSDDPAGPPPPDPADAPPDPPDPADAAVPAPRVPDDAPADPPDTGETPDEKPLAGDAPAEPPVPAEAPPPPPVAGQGPVEPADDESGGGDADARAAEDLDADGGEPSDEDPTGRAPEDPADAGGGHGEQRGRRVVLPRQARIELRVGLGTLLGLDEKPARLPGYGVVHAPLARELARLLQGGEWRVAVHDDGVLIAALLARRRPSGPTTVPPRAADHVDEPVRGEASIAGLARPVVEIHVDRQVLADLDPAAHPGWTALLRELQAQLRVWQQARAEDDAARATEQQARRAVRDRSPDLDPAVLARVAARQRARAREAVQRFPGAALARWIEMRDRECAFGPCGTSALHADLDHTLAVVAEHGLTTSTNLDPLCGHDHDLKHATWQLRQPLPGHFTWTSPSGHSYTQRPRPVVPDVPDPAPPAVESGTYPQGYADDGPIWDQDPYPDAGDGPPTEQDSGHGTYRADPPPPF